MENTTFSTTVLTIDIFKQGYPDRRGLLRAMFVDPRWRPPFLDEMMPDIERVITSVAHRYTDNTTPQLAFDELVGEGKLKLSELITDGVIERLPSRYDFFRFFTTAVNNQARSRVQKYRFTEKRTGQKPPPRHQRWKQATNRDQEEEEHTYHKTVELRLDDAELNIQITQQDQFNEREERDIAEEYRVLLTTDLEEIVFKQLIAPSDRTRCYALIDAYRKRIDEKLSVKIKTCHMAEAVGIDIKLFEKTVLSIRTKIEAYRKMSEAEQTTMARRNAIVGQLKEVFSVQIPPNCDDMIVRRLFTMAARDQVERINDQVSEMLSEIGAKVPRMVGNKLGCYGVLYQKNCRKCNTCDLRHSCAVEAANAGLTKITLSPKLLGARQPRIPVFLPRMGSSSDALCPEDEAEILSLLEDTFERVDESDGAYFYHIVGTAKKRRMLFCVEQEAPLRIKFCNPGDALRKRLIQRQKSWWSRESAPLSEIIEMIEQHARDTFD